MRYRKRIVEVEASQWWQPGDHPAVLHPVPPDVPVLHEGEALALNAPARARLGTIRTLEGWMIVTPGDFIIRGVEGEHYACKPAIFLKTYEPAEA